MTAHRRSRAFSDVLWTPGQAMEPGNQELRSRELTQRLLHLENVIANLEVDDLPVSAIGRKLEQTWRPDPNVLFDTGSVGADLIRSANIVTELPKNPGAGKVVVLQDSIMETQNVKWTLQFDGTRWLFLGGASLHKEHTGGFSVVGTGGSWQDVGGPAISVPAAGTYDVQYGAGQVDGPNSNSTFVGMGLITSIGPIVVYATMQAFFRTPAANQPVTHSLYASARLARPAGGLIKCGYNNYDPFSQVATYYYSHLTVQPAWLDAV